MPIPSDDPQGETDQEKLGRRAAELDRLGRWIEQLYFDVDAITNSRRYRLGGLLIDRVLKPLTFRSGENRVWAPEHAAELASAYEAWRRAFEEELDSEAAERGMEEFERAVAARPQSMAARIADIIICVHNALRYTRACLLSILTHTPASHRLIVVNDGSSELASKFLKDFAAIANCELISNADARGYTRAANQGLIASRADYAVLLNSDTEVTPGWLDRVIECGETDSAIGIVGPLSNAAGWQSVPELTSSNGDWAVNELPPGVSLETYAENIASVSQKRFPRVNFINGFCFAMKRAVIDKIGMLDEERFPRGYGEEDDYCLRARAAGITCAVADHAFVFHAKSGSFGHLRRRELARAGYAALQAKHGAETIDRLTKEMWNHPELAAIRVRVRESAG